MEVSSTMGNSEEIVTVVNETEPEMKVTIEDEQSVSVACSMKRSHSDIQLESRRIHQVMQYFLSACSVLARASISLNFTFLLLLLLLLLRVYLVLHKFSKICMNTYN